MASQDGQPDLFELPRCWLPYLAFAVSCKGEEFWLEPSESHRLACRVPPMGMHSSDSSVSPMQEVPEEVLWQAGLERTAQIRRGHPAPRILMETARLSLEQDRYFWQVYLDNFTGGEKRVSDEPGLVGKRVHQLVGNYLEGEGNPFVRKEACFRLS